MAYRCWYLQSIHGYILVWHLQQCEISIVPTQAHAYNANTVWWHKSIFLGSEVKSSQNISWPIRIEELHNCLKTAKAIWKWVKILKRAIYLRWSSSASSTPVSFFWHIKSQFLASICKIRKQELKTMLFKSLLINLQQNGLKLCAFFLISNSLVQLFYSLILIGQPIFWLDWTSRPKKLTNVVFALLAAAQLGMRLPWNFARRLAKKFQQKNMHTLWV